MLNGLHIDYLQIGGAKVLNLLRALRTEYSKVTRLLDLLVIAGEVDLYKAPATTVIGHLEKLKAWIVKQNLDSTCAFVTLPITPFDSEDVPMVVNIRNQTQHLYQKGTEW